MTMDAETFVDHAAGWTARVTTAEGDTLDARIHGANRGAWDMRPGWEGLPLMIEALNDDGEPIAPVYTVDAVRIDLH